MRLAVLLFLLLPISYAQFSSTASFIRPVSSLPATCTPSTGAVVFKTSSPVGVCQCTATNTWTCSGGGGSSSGTLLTTPAAPTISVQGTPGSHTYQYAVFACNIAGCTARSPITNVTNSASPMDGTDFNRVSVAAVTGASNYLWYVYDPSSYAHYGFIGVTTLPTIDDTNLIADNFGLDTAANDLAPFKNGTDGVIISKKLRVPNPYPGVLNFPQAEFGNVLSDFSRRGQARIGWERGMYSFGNVGPADSLSGLISANIEYDARSGDAQFAGWFAAINNAISTGQDGTPIGLYAYAGTVTGASQLHGIRSEVGLHGDGNVTSACNFCSQGVMPVAANGVYPNGRILTRFSAFAADSPPTSSTMDAAASIYAFHANYFTDDANGYGNQFFLFNNGTARSSQKGIYEMGALKLFSTAQATSAGIDITTCDASNVGMIEHVAAVNGVSGTVIRACGRDAAGVFSWKNLQSW